MQPHSISALAGILGLTLGCFGNSAPQNDVALADADASGPIAVEVDNHGWHDAAIYVVSGGVMTRVGTVTGVSSRTFIVPSERVRATGDFRLIAHPIGTTGGLSTEQLLVRPGQLVRWTLEQHLPNSSVGVY
jgi:hypothetical protein